MATQVSIGTGLADNPAEAYVLEEEDKRRIGDSMKSWRQSLTDMSDSDSLLERDGLDKLARQLDISTDYYPFYEDEHECEACANTGLIFGSKKSDFPGYIVVQRCDLCEIFPGDFEAAKSISDKAIWVVRGDKSEDAYIPVDTNENIIRA